MSDFEDLIDDEEPVTPAGAHPLSEKLEEIRTQADQFLTGDFQKYSFSGFSLVQELADTFVKHQEGEPLEEKYKDLSVLEEELNIVCESVLEENNDTFQEVAHKMVPFNRKMKEISLRFSKIEEKLVNAEDQLSKADNNADANRIDMKI